MAIVTWDPNRDVSLLQGDVNRMFERFFGDAPEARRWIPSMDVVEEGDEYVLRTDLPGMDQSDVHVEVLDRNLRIWGERHTEQEQEREGGYYRFERSHGNFERNLMLPEGVDADAITASFERGVLELHVPKPVETPARSIEIVPQ